jgi:hypothetical protein
LKSYFAEKYGIVPLRLLREQWHAIPSETQVDVRHDFNRAIRDTNKPAYVPGERVEVRVPFEGEAQLFYNSANTMTSNAPRAVIDGNELVLVYETPSDSPRDIIPLVDRALAAVRRSPNFLPRSEPGAPRCSSRPATRGRSATHTSALASAMCCRAAASSYRNLALHPINSNSRNPAA